MRYRVVAAFNGYDVIEPYDRAKEAAERYQRRAERKKRNRKETINAILGGIIAVAFPVALTVIYMIFGY